MHHYAAVPAQLWEEMERTSDRHDIESVEETMKRNGPLPRKPPYIPPPRKPSQQYDPWREDPDPPPPPLDEKEESLRAEEREREEILAKMRRERWPDMSDENWSRLRERLVEMMDEHGF